MFNKRKGWLAIVLTLILVLFNGCSTTLSSTTIQVSLPTVYDGFSVHYIDVGQGDCIFIRLPDGKNMLIDSGDKNDKICEYVIEYLQCYSVENIDYFVLTHPDLDHIGNAYSVINEFNVSKIFVPYIIDELMLNFLDYQLVMDLVKEKQIEIKVSNSFTHIVGQGYGCAFLSPLPFGNSGSSYDELNTTLVSTESLINNLSPIIYLQIDDVRFLFTGDAGKSQENIVIDNYKTKIYHTYFSRFGINVNLENIDFLKVGHHGADDSSGTEFLQLIKPNNAIISVGGNNYYGHPKSEVLERLMLANENYSLYRTDVHGSVAVYKDEYGKLTVTTQMQ